jgi:hypothetical protein
MGDGKATVNQTADIIELSALLKATNPGRAAIATRSDQSTGTLDILPLPATRMVDPSDWIKVRLRLGQIAGMQAGWNGTRGIAPDLQTVVFAGKELTGLQRLGISAPTVNPSPDGAVYAEWHAKGLDVEIVFEAPYKLIVLVEDARHEVMPFEGESSDTGVALDALRALSSR